MAKVLDGSKPLWDSIFRYLTFITANEDAIYERYEAGDENAELIVILIDSGRRDAVALATLQVATERYINDYHPQIATIKGGYAKSKAQ